MWGGGGGNNGNGLGGGGGGGNPWMQIQPQTTSVQFSLNPNHYANIPHSQGKIYLSILK